MVFFLLLLSLAALYVCSSLRLLDQRQRIVVYRAGAVNRVAGPGPVFVWRFIETERYVDVDDKVVRLSEIRLQNNEPLLESGSCTFFVSDPLKAMSHTAHTKDATEAAVRQTLIDVLSRCTVREALEERARLEEKVVRQASERTSQWGVKVISVTLSELPIPYQTLRAVSNLAQQLAFGIAMACDDGAAKQVDSKESDDPEKPDSSDVLSTAGLVDYKFGI